jgi:hypothetical protein
LNITFIFFLSFFLSFSLFLLIGGCWMLLSVVHLHRSKVATQLLPQLRAFEPTLLFISAGFDAHYDDFYHYLTEDDIHWVTQQMCDIVDECQGVGVISVLEGGYSLSSPITASSVAKPASAPTNVAKGSKDAGDSYGLRGKKKVAAAAAAAAAAEGVTGQLPARFAQLPGDGGLVKG